MFAKGMMRVSVALLWMAVLTSGTYVWAEENACIACHKKVTPGFVSDWGMSKHSKEDVTCSDCHGAKHKTAKDANLARLPDEKVCGECH